MGRSKVATSLSLVDEILGNAKTEPLLAVPQDPDYIYPLSAFPPLSTFDISTVYPALVIPARQIPELRKKLSHVLLQRAKLKVVYSLEDKDPVPTDQDRSRFRKVILVDSPDDTFSDPQLQSLLENQPNDFCRATHSVTTDYEDWTVEQVLRRILPVKEVPSAFEIIGDLAHINLRDELLPFKYIVGKALLDKNAPRIKTVVNKLGTIATEFRTFGMEVIAGNKEEGWSRVTVREDGCLYELDFQKVYWNSRLGGEHRRLVELIQNEARASKSNIVVADLMAGIGPFAVPLTSKSNNGNVHVYANDLNPSSYESLVINCKKNKCKDLHCYNMDGRAFCHELQDKGIDFHHVLMNLPATAPEFLDAFRGFTGKTLPRIHVHCFSTKDSAESERETIDRCAGALGVPLDSKASNVVVHTVRNVAPNKNMYCVSFNLPESVRALPRIQTGSTIASASQEPESKRTKLS
jgi:tRNA (guanine37-N1)-methyltransferase